jgi:hypothetical protein
LRFKFTIKALIAFLLLALLAALAVAIAMDTIVTSRMSNVASFRELQGVQEADTTKHVAVKKQAKEKGHDEEARELDGIRGAKVRHFQVISAAQNAQNRYYEALEKGNDDAALRSDLEGRIPEARSALGEMKTLTDREIEILTAIGADAPTIEIARQFYKAMETTVNSLQAEELSEAQLQARMTDIQVGGKNAVANARRIAEQFAPDDLEAADKDTLEQEVVIPGEENAKGLGDILTQMPSIIFGSVAGISEGLNMFNEVNRRYGNDWSTMAQDLLYKQGIFSRNNMNAFQQRIDSYGAGARHFLAEYSPFVKTVGSGIGRGSSVDPLGYGANIIIRFVDPQMTSYVVDEDEDMHWRVVVDKLATKWEDNGEVVRALLVFDYDDTAVGDVTKMVSAIAPGFENYVRESRLVYVRKIYDLRYMKTYVLGMSFQTAQGQEMGRYEEPDTYAGGRPVRRRTLDYKILETIAVVSPPKNKTSVRKVFGNDEPSQPKRETGSGGKKELSSDAGGTPAANGAQTPAPKKTASKSKKQPGVSRKGSIAPPPEGTEALRALGGEEAEILMLTDQHDRGVKYFEEENYGMAYRSFVRAANMREGNYLDAYWAALSAHKAKNGGTVKEWLDKCLAVKPDYLPALEMKKALKLK